MSTRGDKILDAPLAKVGGKGLFVKELETAAAGRRGRHRRALDEGRADGVPRRAWRCTASASAKTRAMPSSPTRFASLDALPAGAVVGTSSLRRQASCWRCRPDPENPVPARQRQHPPGQARCRRVRRHHPRRRRAEPPRLAGAHPRSFISAEDSLPAGGQGAVGIECRSADAEVHALLAPLHHAAHRRPGQRRARAEQAPQRRLPGADRLLRAAGRRQLWLRGLVGQPDGGELLRAEARAARAAAETLGVQVAEALLAQGAGADSRRGLWRGRPAVTAWRLLLTRPAEDCAALAQTLAGHGIFGHCLPLLAIEALPETPEQRALFLDLDRYCAVVAVSKPAARLGLERLDRYWPQPPMRQRWFAVGAGDRRTARRLRPGRPLAGGRRRQRGAARRLPALQQAARGAPAAGADPARRGRARLARRAVARAGGERRLSFPVSPHAARLPRRRAERDGSRAGAQRPGGQQRRGAGQPAAPGRRGLAAAGPPAAVRAQPAGRRAGPRGRRDAGVDDCRGASAAALLAVWPAPPWNLDDGRLRSAAGPCDPTRRMPQ